MCDFRGPPTGLYEFATGKQIPFEYKGGSYSAHGPHLNPKKEEQGIYHICASGSYYAYWDGQKWWKNREDWGPPSEKYWPETGGIHPSYTKYVFLYQPEKHEHCFGNFLLDWQDSPVPGVAFLRLPKGQ